MYQNKRKNLLFLGMIGGMGVFLLFAYFLTRKPEIIENLDQLGYKLYDWISSSEFLTTIFVAVTSLGNKNAFIFYCVVFVISFFFVRRKKLVLFILVTFIFSVVCNGLIKEIFIRERPDLEHLVHIGGFSFPSGHAMNAMVFFGLLMYFFYGVVKEGWQKKMVAIFFPTLIIAIAISRVMVGVHYVSDVLAGLGLGLCILCFALFIYEGTEGKLSRK